MGKLSYRAEKRQVWFSNPGSLALNTLLSTVYHHGRKNGNNEVELEKWRQKVRSLSVTK